VTATTRPRRKAWCPICATFAADSLFNRNRREVLIRAASAKFEGTAAARHQYKSAAVGNKALGEFPADAGRRAGDENSFGRHVRRPLTISRRLFAGFMVRRRYASPAGPSSAERDWSREWNWQGDQSPFPAGPSGPWQKFVRAHLEVLGETDFFRALMRVCVSGRQPTLLPCPHREPWIRLCRSPGAASPGGRRHAVYQPGQAVDFEEVMITLDLLICRLFRVSAPLQSSLRIKSCAPSLKLLGSLQTIRATNDHVTRLAEPTPPQRTARRVNERLATRSSLLKRLKDWNDSRSWQEFFDIYWELIYAVAIKSGLTAAEAEDVVQETVITVANKMPEFEYDPSRSFKAWLLNTARWKIADQFRKRIPRRAGPERRVDETARTSTVERIPDLRGLDFDAVWDAEWETRLQDMALARIRRTVNPKHYQVFDLYVLKKWSVGKVTTALRVSEDQVYQVKTRILKQLKTEVSRLETGLT
jgi:RNA polymerase sigma factor (sigma-70 family)